MADDDFFTSGIDALTSGQAGPIASSSNPILAMDTTGMVDANPGYKPPPDWSGALSGSVNG